MSSLDYRTAGESHGQALIALIEGLPAGVPIDVERVNAELQRIPVNPIEISPDTEKLVNNLVEALQEDDDVQQVFQNTK